MTVHIKGHLFLHKPSVAGLQDPVDAGGGYMSGHPEGNFSPRSRNRTDSEREQQVGQEPLYPFPRR